MFDNQRSAIEYALASRPRGLEIGDKVCYADRAFEVFALQQWALAKGTQEVGLVWAGFCEVCSNGWLQLTETRLSHLAEVCESCSDAVAPTHCSYDGTVGDNLLSGERPTSPDGRPSRGVVRFGANERHVLDVIAREYADIESENADAFIARCAELLPAREDGKRDQRVFLMRRAIQSLCKRKDGPLVLEHGRVIFCR